jgi:TIR domain/Domain of unknown function (DUF4878)
MCEHGHANDRWTEGDGVDQRVFISYSHVDRPYVDGLGAYLGAAGIRSWYDVSTASSDRFDLLIARELDACGALIVIMSPESASSDAVSNQIAYAKARSKPILALLLRGEPFTSLQTLITTNVTGGVAPDERFLGQLRSVLGVTTTTAPAAGYAAPGSATPGSAGPGSTASGSAASVSEEPPTAPMSPVAPAPTYRTPYPPPAVPVYQAPPSYPAAPSSAPPYPAAPAAQYAPPPQYPGAAPPPQHPAQQQSAAPNTPAQQSAPPYYPGAPQYSAPPIPGTYAAPPTSGAWAPGYPGYPGYPMPPQPRRRNGLIIGVAGAVVAVIAIVVVVLVVNNNSSGGSKPQAGTSTGSLVNPDAAGPREAVEKFFSAARNQDVAGVQSVVCSAYRSQFDAASLAQEEVTSVQWQITNVTQNGDTAEATIQLTYQEGGTTHHQTVIYSVIKEDGAWKVCGPVNAGD